MGLEDILRRCVLDHERDQIMHEAHYGPAGGHFQADTTVDETTHRDCRRAKPVHGPQLGKDS